MTAAAADTISTLADEPPPTQPGHAERWVALACGSLSALAALIAAFVSQNGSINPKAMINLAGTDPLAKLVRAGDPHFPLMTPAQHYDGVYYYAIARDPLALGRAHTLIDQSAYRYGHPLHGWLAFLLSAGDPTAIPGALFALSLIGLGTGAGSPAVSPTIWEVVPGSVCWSRPRPDCSTQRRSLPPRRSAQLSCSVPCSPGTADGSDWPVRC